MTRRRKKAQKAEEKRKRRARRAKLPPDLIGIRYTRLIEDYLEHLHDQPAHANRDVFYDQLVVAHLLAFFNPSVTGLRSIEDLFEHPRIRKRYGIPRMPKSTVSDAQKIFDPALLLPLIDSLVERADIQPHDNRLDSLTQKLLAVDGTFFAVAPRIAWALYNQSEKKGVRKGQIRVHVDFDVLKGVPECCTVTDGQMREAKVLGTHLEPDCLYVMDRGFQSYGLLEEIIKVKSSFVVRLRKNVHTNSVRVKPLSDEDVAAGVAIDTEVTLGVDPEAHDLPRLREVVVEFTDREGKQKRMRLLTDLLDIPAWMIALIYQHRWQVELFFRWLKSSASFQHFFSEGESGMTVQVYVMMVALLLIAVETGSRPSKYDFVIVSAVVSGLMPRQGSFEIAERRRRERRRAAERQREKNRK